MITVDELRSAGRVNDPETARLKLSLAKLRADDGQLFLSRTQLDEILMWKLRGQFGRQKSRRAANSDELIGAVTGLAFAVRHTEEGYERELRFGILCSLRGVGVPVASAILALVFPEKYAVVDFRGWRQVFGKERRSFTISDYDKYVGRIRGFAEELGWQPQEVDIAIWEYDRQKGAKIQ